MRFTSNFIIIFYFYCQVSLPDQVCWKPYVVSKSTWQLAHAIRQHTKTLKKNRKKSYKKTKYTNYFIKISCIDTMDIIYRRLYNAKKMNLFNKKRYDQTPSSPPPRCPLGCPSSSDLLRGPHQGISHNTGYQTEDSRPPCHSGEPYLPLDPPSIPQINRGSYKGFTQWIIFKSFESWRLLTNLINDGFHSMIRNELWTCFGKH